MSCRECEIDQETCDRCGDLAEARREVAALKLQVAELQRREAKMPLCQLHRSGVGQTRGPCEVCDGIARLQALVESAYREGFRDGNDITDYYEAGQEPWVLSNSRKALKQRE